VLYLELWGSDGWLVRPHRAEATSVPHRAPHQAGRARTWQQQGHETHYAPARPSV